MNDLITVIIPAYNAEKYITACVESVVSQTYANLEIIIINDGSTDLTGNLLDELAMTDQRIKVIHQKNQGVSATRNTALKIARGNLIGFIDADDKISKDMYEFLYNNSLKHNADISHCAFEHNRANKVVKFHDTGIVLVQNNFEAIKELLSGKRVEPGVWNKLYRKAILQNVFFHEDIKINEDLLFNIEAFKNAEIAVFEDVIKYSYQLNPDSASQSPNILENAKDGYEVAKRIKSLLINVELIDAVNHFYAGRLLVNLKLFKSENLFKSSLAKSHRQELRFINTKKMSFRIRILKSLLLDFPFFYKGFIFFYKIFFAKNQKWK